MNNEIAHINEQMLTMERRLNEIMREVMNEWAERMAQKGRRGWLAMDSDGAVWLLPNRPFVDDDLLDWLDRAISAGEATHITDSVPRSLAARTWRDSLTEVRCL